MNELRVVVFIIYQFHYSNGVAVYFLNVNEIYFIINNCFVPITSCKIFSEGEVTLIIKL